MSKPLRRTYDLRGLHPHRVMVQTGRASDEELASWGYVEIPDESWGVVGDNLDDYATLWRHATGREIWVGKPYDGCETCGSPRDEHVTEGAHFRVGFTFATTDLEPRNARMICENFT
ncbi:MAG TPA: hypothetical protein VJV21_08010 [Pyrinomonadaceae bacterium]|nr:hypothetical protein [Pyrinomonadaceae bacterium]